MKQIYPDEFKNIAKFIRERDDFLIATHFSPDGDAVGCCLGFGEILKALEKKYTLAIEGGAPEKYDFLPGVDGIFDPSAVESSRTFSNLVTLDVGSYKRIGAVSEMVAKKPDILNIDHHPSNSGFGDTAFIDSEASSVCEILFYLACFLEIPINRDLAAYLYMGIMTDTGRFRFGNTTPKALRTCAELVEFGADPTAITEKIYFDLPRSYIEALGKSLYSLQFFADNQLAVMEYHDVVQIEDAEGFIDYAIGIRGVEAAVFIRLIPDEGKFKVSLRGKGSLDVRGIAESFGGGGHTKAAGFRYRGSLKDLKENLLNTIISRLEVKTSSAAADRSQK